jgi:hypothetical protein
MIVQAWSRCLVRGAAYTSTMTILNYSYDALNTMYAMRTLNDQSARIMWEDP